MAITLELLPEFGYVMLVAVLSMLQLMWMANNVMNARKKYNVKPPTMYSDSCEIFNCVQRVHQNTLEGYTLFMTLLLLGGLRHPIISSIGGLVLIVGRYFYAQGYYTGDPEKRLQGAWFHLGELICLGCVISGALGLLGII